ncbi:MAG: choloylglycine hydrolase family protein [Verrucomicrobiota bacterium]
MVASLLPWHTARACTGIVVESEDGSVVFARTMEWGAMDLKSRVAIVPRGHSFTAHTPEGQNGKAWKGNYGFVGIDAFELDAFGDGLNEKGLAVSVYGFFGFASYENYEKTEASNAMAAIDVVSYLLSTFATVEEVEEGLKTVSVVSIHGNPEGMPDFPGHWTVVDRSGRSIVIQYLDGKLTIFENPLGVVTNAPEFSWHMTNLRNYVNLSAISMPTKRIADLDFAPLGAGSGLIGLPGDFTPPSRFVRAVAFTQTARPTGNAKESIYEVFRILDHFNLPASMAEGSDLGPTAEDSRSATVYTSAYDLSNGIIYYHTQHNRRVRRLSMESINFSEHTDNILRMPLDKKREQDYEDIMPGE